MDVTKLLANAILQSNADAIIATDRDGLICYWNKGAERIFGFTAAEAHAQSLDLIIPERFRKRHWDGYFQVVAKGESRYGEGDVLAVPGVTKAGDSISLEFTITLLRNPDGKVIGMASILRDVTARFEEMRAMKKALSQRG
ncbi:MAG: PAS domain-containing protein [Phyllobacterium sp.]